MSRLRRSLACSVLGLVSSSRQLPDGEQLLRPLTSTANLLGYTIYPVDVPGIESEAAGADSFAASGRSGTLREQEAHGTLLWKATPATWWSRSMIR